MVIILDFGLVISSVPEGRPFGMDMDTVISAGVNLINVCILAAALAFLLYRPVRDFLRKRAEKIQSRFDQAEDNMAKATDLKLRYEQKMEEILRERDEILSEARKLAAETSKRIIADAKKEAGVLRERTAANIDMEWERAETEMRTVIIEISAVMAEKFVALAMNKETHDRLFAKTMADLESVKWRD
jgi:F-type H+-transporting ATPase subunit b